MQDVLIGKTDCAEDLMSNACAFGCCFGAADLCLRRLKKHRVLESALLGERVSGTEVFE